METSAASQTPRARERGSDAETARMASATLGRFAGVNNVMAVHPTIERYLRRQGRTAANLHLARSRGIAFDALLTTAMVTLVAAPLLFTRSGFALDFTNALWMTWVAGKEMVAAGHPSYFLNTNVMGVFYPLLAFEGATTLILTGGLGELIGGHPLIAFVGVTTFAIAADYVSTLWLARRFGLRGWLAHVPSITIVTSAYYITNLYGRGAWQEFIALAALPPLAASGVWLAQARSWRVGPVLVFVLSSVVLTGTHNLTLVYGTTMAAIGLLALWLAFGAPRQLPYRRLAAIAGLGVLGLMVNAWFLFPDVAYEQFVGAHVVSAHGTALWQETGFFNTPGIVLDPFRSVPRQSSTPALYVQAPVWLLAWGVLAGGLLLWRGSVQGRMRRLWTTAVVLVLLVLAMIMVKAFWGIVPFPYDEIQFAYRLAGYVVYAVTALVLVSAMLLQQHAGVRAKGMVAGLRVALAGACLISIGLCVWQQWVPNTLFTASYTHRGEALTSPSVAPRTWYIANQNYSDRQATIVRASLSRLMIIQPSAVHGDRFAAFMKLPEGPQPIQSDIDGGAYLVHVSGVRRIGRDKYGFAVVQREGNMHGPVHVVIETAHRAVVYAGRAVSVLALVLLLVISSWIGMRRRARGETSA